MRTLTSLLLANGDAALWSAGDLTSSRRWFDSAYQIAEEQADGPAMASAALGLAGLWVHELRTSAATAVLGDRLRRALDAVPADSSLALRLRTRLAAESDHRTGGHAAITKALVEVRATADPVATADALRLAHHCLLGPEHGARRRELAAELIAESARTTRRGDLLIGLLLRAVDLLRDGEPGADQHLTELRHLLDAKDHRVVRFLLQGIDVMSEIRAGRLEQAEAMAKQCAQDGDAAGDMNAVGVYGVHMLAIRWYQGRVTELLPMVRELADSPMLSPIDYSFRAALAVAAAAAGQRREALGAIAAFQDGMADIPSSCTWLASMYALTEASLLLHTPDVATEAYHLLLPYRRLPIMAGFGSACFGSVEHALGVAQLAIGDVETAATHLRLAVRDNESLGNRPAADLSRRRLANAEALAHASRPKRRALAIAPVAAPLPQSPAASTPSCRRRGKNWQITANGRAVTVEHSRGMAYLAVLLANPGTDITAVELASGPRLRQSAPDSAAREMISGSSSDQPILDEQAIVRYRTRLAELGRILEHDATTDASAQTQAARAEQTWLLNQLHAATGRAGRRRIFATDEERARVSVGKAIRRALARITTLDQQLGALISAGVRTGRVCAYAPPCACAA